MANEEDLSYLSGIEGDPQAQEEVQEEAQEEVQEEAQEEVQEEAQEEVQEEAQEEVQEDVRKPSRGETRIQKLANEARQAREDKIRAEAERDALLKFRPNTSAPDNSESIRQRQSKLDLMEPQERAIYLQNEQLEAMNQRLMVSDLRSQDRADKAIFEAKATTDARYARNKDDVEKELTRLRSLGINANREEVLAQVIGRKLLAEKPRKNAREAAAQRVATTKGKPTNARTSQAAPAGKGDSLSDLESRLRGKSFNSMFNN